MSATQNSLSQRASGSKKRKLASTSDTSRTTKKPKASKKVSRKDITLDLESSINSEFAQMSPDLLADHLVRQTKRFDDDLSLVELEERRIPIAAIRNTTDFEPARTLDKLIEFLQKYSGPKRKSADLNKAAKEKASPHTLVITAAGLRAADVTRALRAFQTKDAMVAKLFAKHIKFDEAKDYVSKTRMGVGVGTPKRISDLLEDGALSPSKLERIVVDVSHIDQKKRGILDMKELQPPLVYLLNRPQLKERYGMEPGDIELIFF